MSLDHQLVELRSSIASLIEELDQVSFDLLREAAASGTGTRPAEDRRLAQARRALEKALHVLESID